LAAELSALIVVVVVFAQPIIARIMLRNINNLACLQKRILMCIPPLIKI
jgi:hypothetical protein